MAYVVSRLHTAERMFFSPEETTNCKKSQTDSGVPNTEEDRSSKSRISHTTSPYRTGYSVYSISSGRRISTRTSTPVKTPHNKTRKTRDNKKTSQDGLNSGFNPYGRETSFIHGSMAREQTFSRGGKVGYMSLPEGLDHNYHGVYKRPLDTHTDRRIVHHLRRKLNKRLERRINDMVDAELSGVKDDKDNSRSRAASRGGPTPFDPFQSYTDVGDKVKKPRKGSKPNSAAKKTAAKEKSVAPPSESKEESLEKEPQAELNKKTPLPGIPRNIGDGAYISSGQTPDGGDVLLEVQQGETGVTFSMTGVDPNSLVDKEDTILEERVRPPEVPVSPVPTPLIQRPETHHQMSHLSAKQKQDIILEGDISHPVKPVPKLRKVFLQSCFTDSDVERTYLIESVYPSLRSYSRERGYDLHLIDPLWANTELISDEHNDIELLTKVIDNCKQQADGINFMLFLGQKLGEVILPTSIPVDEYTTLQSAAQEEETHQKALAAHKAQEEARSKAEQQRLLEEKLRAEAEASSGQSETSSPDGKQNYKLLKVNNQKTPMASREPSNLSMVKSRSGDRSAPNHQSPDHKMDTALLDMWYKLEENSIPAAYKLQKISTYFKDIYSMDAGRRGQAIKSWQGAERQIRYMLQTLSKKCYTDSHILNRYNTTLTDVCLERGLVSSNGCIWFSRYIDEIQQGLGEEKLKHYQDLSPDTSLPDPNRQMALQHWTNDRLPDMIDEDNIRHYKIHWHSRGVSMTLRDHANYVERLGRDFNEIISANIDEVSQAAARAKDDTTALYTEVEQHVYHCQQSSKMFHSRKTLLHAVKKYVRSPIPYPLILHGKPGSGKTSLLAKAAKECAKWLPGSSCVTIVRMIGVTSDSTNIRMLLRNLCLQLCHVFDEDPQAVPHDYKGLLNNFAFRLSKATEQQHLVFFFDGVHMLTDENEGRNMAWLPEELPPHVHMILTTLPDDSIPCFKALKRLIPNLYSDCFQEVGDLAVSDGMAIIEHWFQKAKRRITKEQRDVIVQTYRGCQQPLLLKALFNEAVHWPSILQASTLRLSGSVHSLVTVFIGRLERNHGESLARRALGYITAARGGVTETEMEDLLSLDDAVMGDVMTLIKPPLRRLPTILWLRLKEELGEYITETNADGCVTLKWRHVQFHEAAEERYLNNKDRAPSYHKAMAEYFMDTWTDSPKPYPGNEKGVLRHTMAQPLYREVYNRKTKSNDRVYNLRRLSELPYHFLNSQQMDALKTNCLCNFEFILAKISAVTLRALFEDYQMALNVDPNDPDLKILSDALHLSVSALMKDPRQLASQIIGRMHTIITKDLPVAPGDPVKYPFLKLLFAQSQKASIPALIPSRTCLTPPGGVLFDLLSGHTEPITAVCMAPDGQKCLTTSKDNTMKLWLLKTGRVVKTIVGTGINVLMIRVGGNNAIAITSELTMIRIWSLRSGDCLKVIDDYGDPASIVTASDGMLLVAFYHGSNIMRVWGMGGQFALHQEVFLDEEQESEDKSIHQDNSTIVATNSHGSLILHAYKDSSMAFVRNAKNGNVVSRLKVKDSGSITAMACSVDYFILATRYQYMELHEICCLELFDNRTGAYIRAVRGCTEDIVTELHVNHMGSHAVAVCYSEANNTSDIALWNIETQDHKHLGRHAAVSLHGACIDLRYVLTAAKGENTLRIWNLSANSSTPGGKMTIKEGVERIIEMTNHCRYVVAKSMNNGPISVWNIAKGKCAGSAVSIERGLTTSTDVMLVRNTKVLILTDKGFSNVSEDRPPVFQTLLIYDILKKKYIQKLTGCYITPSQPHEYVFLTDEDLLGVSDNRSHLVVWSTVTGHVVHRMKSNFRQFDKHKDLGIQDFDEYRRKHNTTVMMTPWDRRAESTSARERRHQAEMEEDRQVLEDLKKEKENFIEQYMISKDLSTVITSHYAHHLCVFDITSHSHTHTLENLSSMLFLHIAALTASGGHLVHTNYDEEDKLSYVTMWDCQSGFVRKRLRNEKNVTCIAISDDAHRIVFGKTNKELRIWEPFQPSSMRRIKGYPTLNFAVNSQIHMVDGGCKAIIYAGDISIWDLDNATVLGVFTPDMRIMSFSLAMDGKLIVFGIQDTSDIVTLQLKSNEFQNIEKTGNNLFGEVDSSDDEDDEFESELEKDRVGDEDDLI